MKIPETSIEKVLDDVHKYLAEVEIGFDVKVITFSIFCNGVDGHIDVKKNYEEKKRILLNSSTT